MFGWLKRKAENAIVDSQTTDINRFILGLRGGSGLEVGSIVALTAHWRNLLEKEFGWDLDHPDIVSIQDISIAVKLNSLLRQVQKGNPALAAGVMVWLHTIRASQTPEIRLKGREMWSELARGFPFTEDAAAGLNSLLNHDLDIAGFQRIPANLGTL